MPRNLPSLMVKRIRAVSRPERIIVFGSAARGKIGRDSDIDVLVVESKARCTMADSARLRTAIGDVGFPVDVIAIPRRVFDRYRDTVGGVEYAAARHGKVIYEARR